MSQDVKFHHETHRLSASLCIIVRTATFFEDDKEVKKEKIIYFESKFIGQIKIDFFELVVLHELYEKIKADYNNP